MNAKASRSISFELTAEQLRNLKPVLEEAGKVDIVASIEGSRLKIALLACQVAFTPDLRLTRS